MILDVLTCFRVIVSLSLSLFDLVVFFGRKNPPFSLEKKLFLYSFRSFHSDCLTSGDTFSFFFSFFVGIK